MSPPEAAPQRLLSFAVAALAACGIGLIDYLTGAEISVEPLYFLPLALAGIRLGRAGVYAITALSTAIWLAAQYFDAEAGRLSASVLMINFITQGTAFLVVAWLVSQLSEKLRQEQALRRRDMLTGLLNRPGFVEHAGALLSLCRRNQRSVALAYLDLDHFKQANDRHGHAHGDSLLRVCGSVIGRSVRDSDIAARIGGDEFVVLLPEIGAEAARDFCERLAAALREHADLRASGVSASVGVVVDSSGRLDIDALLRRADEQMYNAKRSGRGAVVLSEA